MEGPTVSFLKLQAQVDVVHNNIPWSPSQWLLDNALPAQDMSPLPKRMKRGVVKYCYHNSLQLAARSKGRYVYVEGWATCIIPTRHGWCIDRETGLIVDKTWTHGVDYVGVPLRYEYAREVLNRHHTPLWNWEEGFPIMDGRVPASIWRATI